MRVSEVKKPAQELLQISVTDVVTVVAIAKVYEKKTAPHERELHKLFKVLKYLQ